MHTFHLEPVGQPTSSRQHPSTVQRSTAAELLSSRALPLGPSQTVLPSEDYVHARIMNAMTDAEAAGCRQSSQPLSSSVAKEAPPLLWQRNGTLISQAMRSRPTELMRSMSYQ